MILKDACILLLTTGCLYTAVCKDIRQAVVAGQFYPGEKEALRQTVETLLKEAPVRQSERPVRGLIVPHAGYAYSGRTAAAGFKPTAGQSFDVAVVLAPSHRESFRGATVYPGQAYRTPLGTVAIDRNTAESLVKASPYVNFSQRGHRQEHAIEVELPFLQVLFPELPFVPVVIGYYNEEVCKSLARALADLASSRELLLIASSDFYHGQSYTDCKRITHATLEAVTRMQPDLLYKGFRGQSYQACGSGPVITLVRALRRLGVTTASVVTETSSGDEIGKRHGYVVGYGSVVFYLDETHSVRHQQYPRLKESAQKELIRIARTAIESAVYGRVLPHISPQCPETHEKRGVFVTLIQNGQLRGCMGMHIGNKPLYHQVAELAVAAATQDPRFPPVTKGELDDIHIKISVYLTDVYAIDDIQEYKLGEHGILFSKSNRSATFLPEVPLEAGWTTREQVLRHLCRKAGLHQDAWKTGARFWVYKTQIFDQDILNQ